jgi:hypothetical protein
MIFSMWVSAIVCCHVGLSRIKWLLEFIVVFIDFCIESFTFKTIKLIVVVNISTRCLCL